MKKRRLLAFVLAVALVITCIPKLNSAAAASDSEGVSLKNLVIREIGKLQPDFSPEITEYEATAYRSTNNLRVFPFAAGGNASVTVNGTALTAGGYVDITPLPVGKHNVNVKVAAGGQEKTYTIHVTKVDTDYRGRKPIEGITATTEFGGDLTKMFDGNSNTYWQPDAVPVSESESNPNPTSFTLDLGQVYTVSRFRINTPTANTSYANVAVRISVRENVDDPWTVALGNGGINKGQGIVRCELGDYFKARYIKYEFTKYSLTENIKISEFTVFQETRETPEAYDPPEGGDQSFVPQNSNITRGQEIVLKNGFPLLGWMPSGEYGRGVPTAQESAEFGWDGPLFYDPPLENTKYMKYNPNSLWGLAKAPWGDNGMNAAGEPRDFIEDSMKPYLSGLTDICFGDEGYYGTDESARYAKWFEWTRENYPGAILHSNQVSNSGNNIKGWDRNALMEYVQTAKPDMLSFDDYYWELFDNQWNSAYVLLDKLMWKNQREVALKGLDGEGKQPILFGQYLDVYRYNQPTSQKNLVVNMSLLTGMKWLNFFRVEFQFDGCYLWDEDGMPTQGLYEWAEINKELKAIDDYILRLNNDWVVSKPGEHMSGGTAVRNNVSTGWHQGGFDESAAKNAEFHIQDVSAKNLSAMNDGLAGDVVLGYFNALPRLEAAELQTYFGTATPKAFMLLNGLNGGACATYGDAKVVQKELGSAENTQQEITVTFHGSAADLPALKKVSRADGSVQTVTLTDNADGNASLTVVMGGGEADLYFWAEESPYSATSQTMDNPAAFAFDGYSDSYWKAEAADEQPAVSQVFQAPRSLGKVILNEEGEAVTGYRLEYLQGGVWKEIPGATGTAIGSSKTLTFDTVQAEGIRLTVTGKNGQPAIREIRCYEGASENRYTITASAGEHGTVFPETARVGENDDHTIVILPENGYHIDTIRVDGQEVAKQSQNQHVLYNVAGDHAVEITFAAVQRVTYLSDLNWDAGATVGWGSIRKDFESNGTSPITLKDDSLTNVVYEKGLGTHANSVISYTIEGKGYDRFESYVGVDASQGTRGTVRFRVYADDKLVFESDVLRSNTAQKFVSVDLTGVKVLKLEADTTEDGNGNDHADWADAKFLVDIPEEPVVSKAPLEAALNRAALVGAEQEYTQESYQAFAGALATVNAMLENDNASQEEIIAAAAALSKAIDELEPAGETPPPSKVNKSTLEAVLKLAKAHSDEVDGLIPSAKEKFEKVLNNAQAVFDSETSTQAEVDKAWKDLMNAIQGLGFVPGAKDELIFLIGRAESIDLTGYQDGAEKEAFEAALQAAKDTRGDADAMQADIDAALKALQTAIDNLIPVETAGDKTELRKVIATAEGYDLNDYVQDEKAIADFNAALAAANKVNGKTGATQGEIDAARLDLITAMTKLRLRADKASLNEWLEKLKAIDLSQYTAESAAAVRQAISEAEALAAQDLGTDEYVYIEAAIAKMKAARDNLQPADKEPEDPKDDESSRQETPSDTESKDDASSKTDESGKADPGSSSKQESTEKTPATGDGAPIAAMTLFAAAAAGVFLVLKNRKKGR